MKTSISIVTAGIYIPYLRLTREEYVRALGNCSAEIKEKAVPDVDEDTLTMAVAAAREVLKTLNDPREVGVLALAATSVPYQEKVLTSTLLAALDLPAHTLTLHHGNSTLAGTEALLTVWGLLGQIERRYGLVVIADAPAAVPGQEQEQGLGAGACALLLARDEPGLTLEGFYCWSEDYPGLRFRPAGEQCLRDINVRTYSQQAYRQVVSRALTGLMQKLKLNSGDFRLAVLPQFDVRTTLQLGRRVGFSEEQLQAGLVYPLLGDAGAATPFLGLCRAMEHLAGGERILLAAYGAGSGCQAVSLHSTGKVKINPSLERLLECKKYISFSHYLKLKKVI